MRNVVILAAAVWVGGCLPDKRVDGLENRLEAADRRIERNARDMRRVGSRVTALQQELDGVGRLKVGLRAGNETTVYGNQSGYNANISVLSASGGAGLQIRTQRIAKPADGGGGAPLPENYEKTNWLDLSARGSRRQAVIPCGFELVAKTSASASIDVVVKYEPTRCSPL